MAIRTETWKALYNLFDPSLRVEEWQQEALFVERPGDVTQEIVDGIESGFQPDGAWVVCGSAGSGKSSALVHLATVLRANLGVIALDLPRSVARMDDLQPAEILFLIGAGALQVLREDLRQEVDPALQTALETGFRGLLAPEYRPIRIGEVIKGVARFAANVAVPGAGEVANAALGAAEVASGVIGDRRVRRSSGPLGGLTRNVHEGEPDLEYLRAAVEDILQAFSAVRAPVILVDGLDKIRRVDTIRRLFVDGRSLSELRAPIVYSGPITLMLSTDWQITGSAFSRVRLANVPVLHPTITDVSVSQATLTQGRDTLRELVARRLRLEHLRAEDVFAGGALDQLIDASGGLLRDLVRLVRHAIAQTHGEEQDQIDEERAEAAIEKLRKEYEITLNTRRVDELRHVRETGEPSGEGEVSFELLAGGYILPYSNGRIWFAPHPILRGVRPGL